MSSFVQSSTFFDQLPSSRLTSIITVAFCNWWLHRDRFFASSRYASRSLLGASKFVSLAFASSRASCSRSCEIARCLTLAFLQVRELYRDRSCNTRRCLAVALLSSLLVAIAFTGDSSRSLFAIGRSQNITVAFRKFAESLRSFFAIRKSIVVAFASARHRCNCICNWLSSLRSYLGDSQKLS